jgi:hypothetical protein
MDIVTALSVIKCLGVIANRVEATSLIGLLEDRPSRILRGIHFKGVWSVGVGLLEDWVTQNDLFKLLNGSCAAGSPSEGYILLGELGQGLGNVCEATNKWSLIAENAECALDVFHGSQLFQPRGQALAFRWIYADSAITDDNAEVLN